MISDDTLREGLQTPGISFTVSEKVRIASLLSKSGIRRALVSYPSSHRSEQVVTEEIVRSRYFEETFALGRTTKSDIDLIINTGANISLHLPPRIENIEDLREVILYASRKDCLVEVGVLDIVNYTENEILKIVRTVRNARADIIQLPDTTGSGTPQKIRSIISKVRSKFPDLEIEVHCHNDKGGAVANSLAGIEAGASFVDTTCLGIGERNGIADTVSTVSLLEASGYRTDVKIEKLKEVYSYLMKALIKKVGLAFFIRNLPVFGSNISTVTAGTHAIYPQTFEGGHPTVNVYAGRTLIRKILLTRGLTLSDKDLLKLVTMIKDRSVDEGKAISIENLFRMVKKL